MEVRVEPVPVNSDVSWSASAPRAADRKLAELAQRYPQAAAMLLGLPEGGEAFAHIAALDRRWAQALRGELPARALIVTDNALPRAQREFDIIVAGGGIGLFSATLLAQAGYQVMVFDSRRVGAVHRMWNISEGELSNLVRLGFCSWADLEPVILRRYQRGLVRIHPTAAAPARDLALDGVLDLALDAELLLALARQRFLAAGGTVLDGRTFRRAQVVGQGTARVVVDLETSAERCERYGARLLVNAMGALSPLTLALHGGLPFGGVCPTVGSVATGFRQGTGSREVDLSCGEVLVSIDEARTGRQLLWEGFPGQGDELTVYLFYYDAVRRGRAAAPQSLLALFEQYIALLPSYKAPGPEFLHLRPLYGFIPAYYRQPQRRAGAGLARSVLSIGDAAAEHSALTFCGFGSHIRNLGRICELSDYALRHDLLEPQHLAHVCAAQPNLALHGVFSRFMRPWQSPDDVNAMLGAVCGALHEIDQPTVRRFFQDRSSLGDYNRILVALRRTAPGIVPLAAHVLGWRESLACMRDVSAYVLAALLQLPSLLLSQPLRSALQRLLDRRPALGLLLHAYQARQRVLRDPGFTDAQQSDNGAPTACTGNRLLADEQH